MRESSDARNALLAAIVESSDDAIMSKTADGVITSWNRGAVSVSLTVSPIHDGAGRLIGMSSIARDISERKRADERLRAASRDARSLMEASLDPLVTISPEGKITDVNEATVEVTGVPRKDLVTTDFSDSFTEPDKARGLDLVYTLAEQLDARMAVEHEGGTTFRFSFRCEDT